MSSPTYFTVKNAWHICMSIAWFSNLAEAQEIYVHIFLNSLASQQKVARTPDSGTFNQTAQVNIDEWRSAAPCDSCKYLYMRPEYLAILNRSVSCSLFATNKALPAKTQTLHRNTGGENCLRKVPTRTFLETNSVLFLLSSRFTGKGV